MSADLMSDFVHKESKQISCDKQAKKGILLTGMLREVNYTAKPFMTINVNITV